MGASEPELFFVLGYQKSGTTWLAKLLDGHPEICCDGEGHFYKADADRLYLEDALAASSPLRAWTEAHYNAWTRGRDFADEASFFAAAITRAVLCRAARGAGKRLVGDKSGVTGKGAVESLWRLFPEARLIHLLRDPRDVAVSKRFHLWRGVKDGALVLDAEAEALRGEYFRSPERFGADRRSVFDEKYLRAFMEEWRDWVPSARAMGKARYGSAYLEVRYEDLSVDPVATTRAVFAHLGASTDAALVQSCVARAAFEVQAGRPRGELAASEYFRRGTVGDWRNYFTEGDKNVFRESCGVASAAFGYADEG